MADQIGRKLQSNDMINIPQFKSPYHQHLGRDTFSRFPLEGDAQDFSFMACDNRFFWRCAANSSAPPHTKGAMLLTMSTFMLTTSAIRATRRYSTQLTGRAPLCPSLLSWSYPDTNGPWRQLAPLARVR